MGVTAPSQTPSLPSEITGKTIEEVSSVCEIHASVRPGTDLFCSIKHPGLDMAEQIIKDWTLELQERTSKFRKQAEAIGEWDRRIISNRNVLLKLEVSGFCRLVILLAAIKRARMKLIYLCV